MPTSSTRPERRRGRARGLLLALLLALALPALEAPPKAAAAKQADRYRQALLRELNRVRARHALPRVRFDGRLARAATAHSRDMARNGYFAHGSWTTRVRASAGSARSVGEVIGWQRAGRPGREARAIVRSWLGSAPHRAVLLDRGFRRVGLGRATARWSGRPTALYTADFASAG